MTAWRHYFRTLDEDHAARYDAQGAGGSEAAALSTWIRREAEREGLEVHPTATPWITRLDEGGVCVSIAVRADPDPLYVEPAPVALVPPARRSPWVLWALLGLAWIVGAIVIGYLAVQGFAALYELAAPRSAPDPTAPQPGASVVDVVPDGAVMAQVTAGASDREPSGAPRDGVVATAPAPRTLDPRVGREGDIAYADTRRTYVAIPLGPGIRIRVCGPASCEEMVSTDAGPNRAMLLEGRIMDLDLNRWERICGMPHRFGLCPGSWVRVGASSPRMTLPPTDVTP